LISITGIKTSAIISLTAALLLGNVGDLLASSGCSNMPIDVVNEVCWDCMYPMKLGGVTILDGSLPDSAPDNLQQNAICQCPTTAYPWVRIGLSFSFWEPSRLIETVKTPYCFPAMGYQMNNPNPGSHQGSTQKSSDTSHGTTFAQVHYYAFAIMAYVSSVISAKCGSGNSAGNSFDLAYMTEPDALWNDEMTTALIFPEELLFANPYAQYACVADAVAVDVAGLPLNPLFWCMGSQGPVYPIVGHYNGENFTEANFALASRFIYKEARDYAICDPALDWCNCVTYPLWVKDHYRIQIAKPVASTLTAYPIGRTGMLWDAGKNPPFSVGGNSTDNFLWILFRKHACCISYY